MDNIVNGVNRMTDGEQVIDDLRFEKLVKAKSDRELSEFIAWQQYQTKKDMYEVYFKVDRNAKQINKLWIIIVSLIFLLIGLGLIDANITHLFSI